jgi:hypothetical protein
MNDDIANTGSLPHRQLIDERHACQGKNGAQ